MKFPAAVDDLYHVLGSLLHDTSLAPRPSLAPVFDLSQYTEAIIKTGTREGLGMRQA